MKDPHSMSKMYSIFADRVNVLFAQTSTEIILRNRTRRTELSIRREVVNVIATFSILQTCSSEGQSSVYDAEKVFKFAEVRCSVDNALSCQGNRWVVPPPPSSTALSGRRLVLTATSQNGLQLTTTNQKLSS